MKRFVLAASSLALMAAGPLGAATEAYAVTDLNLRAGPGPQYDILDVIKSEDAAMVEGCLPDTNWCKVNYGGATGWAFGEYLAGTPEATAPIYAPEAGVEIGSVTYVKPNDEGAALGAVAGAAVAGAAIGGPLAIAGGFLLGSSVGASVDMEETTITYIRENPVDPVYADGEVVVGAKIEGEPVLHDIPGSDYAYLALNNTQVVVDPESQQIVYILR